MVGISHPTSSGHLAAPPNIFLIAFASALVDSSMKAGAQGACNTVSDFGFGEGRIVALGPRSGGLLEPVLPFFSNLLV
jgi:hypothetical protein